jgi:hypothetical protein
MLAVGGPGGPQKPGGAPGPGAPAPLSSISAVGTDGNLRVNDLTEVEGSLVTAGTRGPPSCAAGTSRATCAAAAASRR